MNIFFKYISLLEILCFLVLGCDYVTFKNERERAFKDDLQRINALIRDYNQVPEGEKLSENQGVIDVFFWKDKEELRRFYEKKIAEFQYLDASLKTISEDRNNILFDDALFARGILHSLWGQIDRNEKTLETAIAVLREFLNLTPSPHIEEFTKDALQDSFWKPYREIATPSLSYEENVHIVFINTTAYFLTIMKRYDAAEKEYESIVKTYPKSRFAPFAETQIQIIGKISERESINPQTSLP